MEIGKKIVELRKRNNLSQEQLAEIMGVARQTISKWELGETSPDIVQAKKISEYFKVSLDDLTGNDRAKKDINDMKIMEFNSNDEEFKKIINLEDYKTAQELLDYIREYNLSNNGICE